MAIYASFGGSARRSGCIGSLIHNLDESCIECLVGNLLINHAEDGAVMSIFRYELQNKV